MTTAKNNDEGSQSSGPKQKRGRVSSFAIGSSVGLASFMGLGTLFNIGATAGLIGGLATWTSVSAATSSLLAGTAAAVITGGGLLGATCYGTYKLGKNIYNKMKSAPSLDQTWNLRGVFTGVATGLALSAAATVMLSNVAADLDEDTLSRENQTQSITNIANETFEKLENTANDNVHPLQFAKTGQYTLSM